MSVVIKYNTGMAKIWCMGIECPIKNRCIRYTKGLEVMVYDGTKDRYMRHCTNQKKYVQDEDNVIKKRE